MKIKTSEAKGAALDWLVCKCEGMQPEALKGHVNAIGMYFDPFSPTSNWADAGLIIERVGIGLYRNSKRLYANDEKRWESNLIVGLDLPPPRDGFRATGPTPLIAAMRCYVMSKLGAEVEVPDELIEE